MDDDLLEKLHASLSLDDKLPPVLEVDENTVAAERTRVGNCLVGRVLTSRSVNREAFRSSMARLWGLDQDTEIQIESLEKNRFVFHFPNVQTKRRILLDGPWHFNRALIVFEEPGLEELRNLQFKFVDFWVQIHNVPVACMSERMGMMIGKMIGDVRELDGGATGSCLGKFLCVRVKVDVSKPLMKVINIVMIKDAPPVSVFLVY